MCVRSSCDLDCVDRLTLKLCDGFLTSLCYWEAFLLFCRDWNTQLAVELLHQFAVVDVWRHEGPRWNWLFGQWLLSLICAAEESEYLQIGTNPLVCGCAGRRLQHFSPYYGMVILWIYVWVRSQGFGSSIWYLLLYILVVKNDIWGAAYVGSLGFGTILYQLLVVPQSQRMSCGLVMFWQHWKASCEHRCVPVNWAIGFGAHIILECRLASPWWLGPQLCLRVVVEGISSLFARTPVATRLT